MYLAQRRASITENNAIYEAIDWQTCLAIPPQWSAWLLHKGSFMQRLRAHGVVQPQIQVLQQYWGFPLPTEKACLSMPVRTYALIREVLIWSTEKKWMLARTVFPRATLTGTERQLARLKNRALGAVLFKHPSIQRSHFDIARLADGWARRSLFFLRNKPLLLTEVFLHDITTLFSVDAVS